MSDLENALYWLAEERRLRDDAVAEVRLLRRENDRLREALTAYGDPAELVAVLEELELERGRAAVDRLQAYRASRRSEVSQGT